MADERADDIDDKTCLSKYRKEALLGRFIPKYNVYWGGKSTFGGFIGSGDFTHIDRCFKEYMEDLTETGTFSVEMDFGFQRKTIVWAN